MSSSATFEQATARVDVQAACESAGSLVFLMSVWCKRWNLEHAVLDLFSHFKSARSSGFFFSRVCLVVAQASALCLKCLHRSPNCLLSVVIMCAAVSSDILVGALPRIMCGARARSSSSELVDTATVRRRQRVEVATCVGLQFPFGPERRGRAAPSLGIIITRRRRRASSLSVDLFTEWEERKKSRAERCRCACHPLQTHILRTFSFFLVLD